MRCRSCRARLTDADNYCRKCGAAVDVIDVTVVGSAPAGPVATLRAAAVPAVARGATVIVAGTLLRFALKRLLVRPVSGRSILPFGRRRARLEAGGEIVEEIVYYRRVRNSP